MNTLHLLYLLEIADCHSINQAAKKLGLRQSYLSKILSSLEDQIGTRIFIRDHKGVTPTTNGQWVLDTAREIVRLSDDLEHRFNDSAHIYPQFSDRLHLYATLDQALLDSIQPFRRQFPNVNLVIADKNMRLLPDLLAQADEDSIAVYAQLTGMTANNPPLADNLIFTPITTTPIVALASPDNPIAQRYRSMSLSTLAKQDLVIFGTNDSGVDSFLGSILGPDAQANIRYTVTNHAALLKLLSENHYFSIGRSGHNDALLEIPLRENIAFEIGLLYQRRFGESLIGRHFIETFLSAHYKF